VTATMTLSPAYPSFAAYGDYTFYDPQRAKDGVDNDVGLVQRNEVPGVGRDHDRLR